MSETKKVRSGISIMLQLIGLVKPLLLIMIIAIVLGVLGFLCAIFLTIIAGVHIINGLETEVSVSIYIIIFLAVMRGVLHYVEQYCNHFIAFKLLAIIRNNVFKSLRKLSPAKLEGRDKGNLISIITTDIELLEVFYAHTISPIAIGVITSIMMVIFIGNYSIVAGGIALIAYSTIGIFLPLFKSKKGATLGLEFREGFGNLNSFVLESLRGVDEVNQYNHGEKQIKKLREKSNKLIEIQKELNKLDSSKRSLTTFSILFFSFLMFFVMLILHVNTYVSFEALTISTIAMMGSFGPVVALANLSSNLNQTLASGERVLTILEEKPLVEDVYGSESTDFENGIKVNDIDFAYEKDLVLENYSIDVKKGNIVGIHGVSGSGKSTLLKLIMRFFDVNKGKIEISNKDIREINTSNLRNMQSYVTQETYLFNDTIANNISIGKLDATKEEIVEAAQKSSIHEFITNLPKGYETNVGELGDTLSGGERQRIGLARSFLHNGDILLLDEPTSNLDSLNEGIILKSLKDTCEDKTVILVSHRASTMKVCDVVFNKG